MRGVNDDPKVGKLKFKLVLGELVAALADVAALLELGLNLILDVFDREELLVLSFVGDCLVVKAAPESLLHLLAPDFVPLALVSVSKVRSTGPWKSKLTWLAFHSSHFCFRR